MYFCNRCRKGLWQDPTYLHGRSPRTCRAKGNISQCKSYVLETTNNIIQNGENIEAIPLKSGKA